MKAIFQPTDETLARYNNDQSVPYEVIQMMIGKEVEIEDCTLGGYSFPDATVYRVTWYWEAGFARLDAVSYLDLQLIYY